VEVAIVCVRNAPLAVLCCLSLAYTHTYTHTPAPTPTLLPQVPLASWEDAELHVFVKSFISTRFPTVLILNKVR
jgi:hypothetical protein